MSGIIEEVRKAKQASSKLAIMRSSDKDRALEAMAAAIEKNIDYFIEAKMDREQSRSKVSESLKAITEDINASSETKKEAYDKMIALSENTEKEMRIEALINKMGFEESFVLFADNGSIDVVVKTPDRKSVV